MSRNVEYKVGIQPAIPNLFVGITGHNKITIFCDGYFKASGGGIATWSWVAVGTDGQAVESNKGYAGRGDGMTHFVAGYTAIIDALCWIQANEPDTPIELCIDLELVIRQMLGEIQCKAEHLRPLYDEACKLISSTKAELRWIPGALNKRAKALSRLEYQEQLSNTSIDLYNPNDGNN
jgi:ribonuclease HI